MNASSPVVAIYPGSFDPITRGHEDIARRTLRVADRLIIAVAHTATQSKNSLFDVDERLELMRLVFAEEDRVEACAFSGLLVDFARARDVRFVIRGLRAVSDFEYELQMAQMNRELWPDLETVFLAPEVDYSFLSSSLVREVARLGGDVSRFVSPVVAQRVREKLAVG
ncbi:MAG: pantetheine-phosphate adenylyltransferase [Gemmatimonadetes bacterium]|nr:pantetheine-phosphate adenylyltransferase [Gemmatimonadota bacterium]